MICRGGVAGVVEIVEEGEGELWRFSMLVYRIWRILNKHSLRIDAHCE